MGKAAEGMTRGAAEAMGDFESALVVTKHRMHEPAERFIVLEAGHPIPDERSVVAGQAILDFVSLLGPQDLLLCLVSGGGSSLATAPADGVSLRQIQDLTSEALASGAEIGEINNLRGCLDRLKGGGLATATRAQICCLILSDVIGDRLEAIASGPTVAVHPDPDKASRLLARLPSGQSGSLEQILKPWIPRDLQGTRERVRNVIVGNAGVAAEGALKQARREGFHSELLEPAFEGEAQGVGLELSRRLATATRRAHQPGCMIAVGETTVSLPATHGLGGRNQELALAAVESLDTLGDCMLVSLATDGEDGPTDAAGAVVTGETAARARQAAMLSGDFLNLHDSYRYFDALGDLIRPGSTGTNVNDLVVLFAL
jgi:hydroxypyruvate reductase